MPLNGYVASTSADSTIIVWNPKTWTSIQSYTAHNKSVLALDQIDNDTIVSGSNDCSIRIWRISTGETLAKINTGSNILTLKFLGNGFQIACGLAGSSNNLRIYNYSSGNLVQTLNGHSSNVNTLEILDGEFMASGSADALVLIWSLSDYTVKYNLTGHAKNVLCLKRLSSSLLASAGDSNGTIITWNWLTGERVHTLNGHTSSLYLSSLDLYDEHTLISGSFDRTIKFWNISNGEWIQLLSADIQIGALAIIKTTSN